MLLSEKVPFVKSIESIKGLTMQIIRQHHKWEYMPDKEILTMMYEAQWAKCNKKFIDLVEFHQWLIIDTFLTPLMEIHSLTT